MKLGDIYYKMGSIYIIEYISDCLNSISVRSLIDGVSKYNFSPEIFDPHKSYFIKLQSGNKVEHKLNLNGGIIHNIHEDGILVLWNNHPIPSFYDFKEVLSTLRFLDTSIAEMPSKKSHKGHAIIRNQADGNYFRVCKDCKVEVDEQGVEV